MEDGQVLSTSGLPLDSNVNSKPLKLRLVYPAFYSSMEQELINISSKLRKGPGTIESVFGHWIKHMISSSTSMQGVLERASFSEPARNVPTHLIILPRLRK